MGAWCGLGCLQFFVCEQLARLGWPGHYSMTVRFISDLGERSLSRGYAVMNGSFFVQGLLICGAVLLGWGKRPFAGMLPRGCLLVAALGIMLVAYAPADRNLMLHIWAARWYFGAGALGMLLWGFVYAGQRRAALAAGGVAVLGDFLLACGPAPLVAFLGAGTVERLAAYPLPLWLAYTGWAALRSPNSLDL